MDLAALLLAIVGLTQALRGLGLHEPWHTPKPPPAAGSLPATAPAVPQRWVPVDMVERRQFQQVQARLPPDAVVLDLEALESLDAALDLVAVWRGNHPADAFLTCWLAIPDHGPALAAARQALAAQGCSALRVARSGPAS
mgnify:CR=1 FL=1|jgi:hypothetical protein